MNEHAKALSEYIGAYRILLRKLGESHAEVKKLRGDMERAYQKTNNPKPFADWLKESLGA
jgi:hypothetical protein